MTVAAGTRTRPATVTLGGRPVAVTRIVDQWLIEDEWWRAPIKRAYYQALLSDGRLLTLFHDEREGGWYLQRYAAAAEA